MAELRAALEEAGIAPSEETLRRLTDYAERVLQANAAQNLTALRSGEAFAREGIVDSLLAWQAIAQEGRPGVLDVGSGSGLPALVWLSAGLVREVTLLEAERRKADFLREASSALSLPAQVIWGRAEEAAGRELRDKAQLVTARALAPAPVAIEVCGGLVAPGGALALLKGRRAVEEAAEGEAVARRMGFGEAQVRRYDLFGQERAVLVYRKERPTPKGRPTTYARLRREFPTHPVGARGKGEQRAE